MTDDNHSMCHFYCNFSVFPHIITVSPDITDIFASQIQTYGRHIKNNGRNLSRTPTANYASSILCYYYL